MGAQRLSGRVLDSRPRGRGCEHHRRHWVVSLSKNSNPSLVLVQPKKTCPFINERLLMGRKISNQVKQTNKQIMMWVLKRTVLMSMIWFFWAPTSFVLIEKKYDLISYSKTCVKRPLSKRPQIGFQDQFSLNAGQSIAECSKWSILQYFRPSLSYHLSKRSLFCLFLRSRSTQVILYSNISFHGTVQR